ERGGARGAGQPVRRLATGTIGVSLRSPVRAEVNSRHCCASSSSECAMARQLAYAAASNRHDPTTQQCKRDYERCDKQYIEHHSEVPSIGRDPPPYPWDQGAKATIR